ncbi:arylsulfatase [Haloferula sp. A504]|uniref:arylsulfatase n=1 Tax=Haloferula sp. A504 TaxID=3373601 RepID=UPI0031C5E898|nr:arylsulfatase [Verrucomicrobiaceae bacterium E54]
MKFILLVLLSAVAAAAKPNIVYIITDDLGYGDLGCYGQKHFETPVLDGLASEGLRFTDHYSGATVCAPSRCALMTGRDTGHASVRGNGAFTLRPDPEDITVATLLQSAGYRTAMVGKSCVTGNTQTPEVVLAKGFDVFYGTTSHVDGHFRYPEFVYDQTEKVTLEGNTLHAGKHYDAELYTQRAEKFIHESAGKSPFFLLLSYPIPHAAVLAPEGEVVEIEDDVDYTPKRYHYSQVTNVKGNYAGMVQAIDAYVGRIMKALESKGVAEDTLVIFTSDNGSHFEGGYKAPMLDSNAPLRGGKRDLYEGGIRVPMIAHWPQGIAEPGDVSLPSAFWDFLPTACELAGIEAPGDIQGISFAPTLTGKGGQKKHEQLYWEFHEQGGRRALRMGDWKLVQYGLKPGKFGKPQLYHLARDIGEQDDLAARHPDKVADMVRRMDEARVPSERFPLKGLDELR